VEAQKAGVRYSSKIYTHPVRERRKKGGIVYGTWKTQPQSQLQGFEEREKILKRTKLNSISKGSGEKVERTYGIHTTTQPSRGGGLSLADREKGVAQQKLWETLWKKNKRQEIEEVSKSRIPERRRQRSF